jgi:RNA polymerase sigma-70 factor (ECF subfamily)
VNSETKTVELAGFYPAATCGAATCSRLARRLTPLFRRVGSNEDTFLSETPNPEFDLSRCLSRVQEDDQAAAADLVEQIYPLVIKIVRRNLARRDSEEDVAQEIFMKIFASLGTFKNIAPFEHWVSRIAVNACMNRLRAEKTRPELRWADLSEAQADALQAVTAGKGLGPGEELSARDLADHLLARLSPEDRLILRMLEMEGASVKEVSSCTGWTCTFIRVRAFRARQKLNHQFLKLWKKGSV